MSLSVRSRFEIFKRDGFTCAYCGRTPEDPGVKLEVDHIMARASGGTEELTNLITACWDCNHGKAAKSLGDKLPTISKGLENTKERARQLEDYREWQRYLSDLHADFTAKIWDRWVDAFDGEFWKDGNVGYWQTPIGMPDKKPLVRYYERVPLHEIFAAIDNTSLKWRMRHLPSKDILRYFFGTLRSMASARTLERTAEDENARLRDLFLNREAHGFESFAAVVDALWPPD